MNQYHIKYEITPIDEVVETLQDYIKFAYIDDPSIPLDPVLETKLDERFSGFKEDIYCLVEYPYVDKLYRNSFYSYYASKHKHYNRDCIRISLFSKEISLNDFTDSLEHDKLQEMFLGTVIVRPTMNALFGRTLISPDAFQMRNFKICYQVSEFSVFGLKLKVKGFSHCSQDKESIKCAETSIWVLMDYFSTKYAEYKPVLPFDIHKTLELVTSERQIPSVGLSMDEISFALKQYGFGTKIYSERQYRKVLYNIIDCYVESGIPVLLGLESLTGDEGHVVVCIGKSYEKRPKIGRQEKFMCFGASKKFYDASNNALNYVVQDDNYTPYQLIDLKNPAAKYEGDSKDNYKIDSVIVPLYPKVYLEAVVAKEMFLKLIGDRITGYNFPDGQVLRRFLASSRSFKAHIGVLALDMKLKATIMGLKMPKFIWVAEVYNKGAYNMKDPKAEGLMILDATEANQVAVDTLIFAGYPDRSYLRNENKYVTLNIKLDNYVYYSNLK